MRNRLYQGNITARHIWTIHPFGNQLAIVQILGMDIGGELLERLTTADTAIDPDRLYTVGDELLRRRTTSARVIDRDRQVGTDRRGSDSRRSYRLHQRGRSHRRAVDADYNGRGTLYRIGMSRSSPPDQPLVGVVPVLQVIEQHPLKSTSEDAAKWCESQPAWRRCARVQAGAG